LDQRGSRANRVFRESKEKLVHRVNKEFRERLGHKASRANRVFRESKENKEFRVFKVSRVFRELLVKMEKMPYGILQEHIA
jgi:hypothetical protein